MTKHSIAISVALAALIGIVQAVVLVWVWANLVAHSPVASWLLGAGLRGTAFQAAAFLTDFITNIALSLPAAGAILMLRPRKLWLYLAVAIVPMFIWQNAGLIGSHNLMPFHGGLALSLGMQLSALPVACLLLVRVIKPQAPNNSFKPTAGVGLV